MNEIERDRGLDAAWGGASREQPPPELDAAIRVAAREAVHAAPGPRRNQRWWYPLAAAATVAVLAVGIAQLTPPEQVAPTIADRAGALREARQAGQRQSLAIDTKPPVPPAAAPAGAPSAQARPNPARSATAATNASGPPRPAANAAQEQAIEAEPESPSPDKLARGAPERQAANTAPSAGAVAPAPAASPRSEPFPATSVAPRRDASTAESAPAGAEPRQLQSRMAAATVARADEAQVKDASTRSVEKWIRRIRELKNEGRADQAAKELAAFRAAYGDRADTLLPADLQPSKP